MATQHYWSVSIFVASLAGAALVAACTTDDTDPQGGTGGSVGSGGAPTTGGNTAAGGSTEVGGTTGAGGTTPTSGGTTSTSGGSTSTATICGSPNLITASTPGVVNFDAYDSKKLPTEWSFPLGGDTSTGVIAGMFSYGDDAGGLPEKSEIRDGHSPPNAFIISDTNATEYGGGFGIWLSNCIDAKVFQGISFWAKANAPTGKVKFSLYMEQTTPATPDKPGAKFGTCPGTKDTCKAPSHEFAVTTAWTKVEIPWSAFKAGDAAGTPVVPNGANIWQLQWDIALVFQPNATSGEYEPVAGPYDLAIDDVTFY